MLSPIRLSASGLLPGAVLGRTSGIYEGDSCDASTLKKKSRLVLERGSYQYEAATCKRVPGSRLSRAARSELAIVHFALRKTSVPSECLSSYEMPLFASQSSHRNPSKRLRNRSTILPPQTKFPFLRSTSPIQKLLPPPIHRATHILRTRITKHLLF